MVFVSGGQPNPIVGGIGGLVAENEHNLLLHINGKAAEHGVGAWRKWSQRVEYKLMWDRLALFAQERIDQRDGSQLATGRQHGWGNYTGGNQTRRQFARPNATQREELESEQCEVRCHFGRGSKEITLAEQANAVTEERPDPNEKLVKIFDSEQESEALVVKGLLDSAGIDNDLKSASFLQEAFPGLGGMIILVREEDKQKALELIEQSRAGAPAAEPDDDETSA